MKLQRAYSFIEVKSFDDDKREITGIATSPSVDRAGDIVEPKGADFKLPIALLWQHDSSQPIGHVTAAKVTAAGIEIKATLVKVDEPGTLKDRLDEAWQSLKSGLVKGLSIGFQPIESARIEGTYGLRFIKWLWLELSAVTIPANADASILSLKSIDTQLRAASGQARNGVVRISSPAGVSAALTIKQMINRNPQEGKSMNVQEQIKAFEASRVAKAAALEAIMAKAGEAGETLDAEQGEAHDTLAGEIEGIDKHLDRLRKHEAALAVKAVAVKTVVVDAAKAGSDARGGVIAVAKKLEKGIAFARFAGCLARAKGSPGEALSFAKEIFPEEVPLHNVLKLFSRMDGESVIKAAVAAGTSTDATWAGPLVQYQQMSQDFIEFLRPQTIVGKIPGLRQVPFNIRMPRQTGGGSAGWVGEGQPKGVTALAFDNVTLRFTKLATISVITEELARFSTPSAEVLIRDSLAAAIIQQMDTDFIDPDNAGIADVKPASITHGVTPIASSGTSEANIRTDIRAVFAPFIAANLTPATGVWIMSATTALALSLTVNALGQPSFPGITMNGGTFFGMPVVVSEAAGVVGGSPGGHIVVLVNARDILLADDGQVTVDVSREASLQMNSTPDAPPTAATVFTSLWQTNSIGIRAERYVNWVKARAAAVAFLNDVNWT